MSDILTLKEIKNFIDANRSQLDKDSTVILTHKNNFSFVKFASFLNLDGDFDWRMDNGELLEGVHGDVMTLWSEANGTFVEGERSDNIARTHDRFFGNFMFDGTDSVPKNLQGFEYEIDKSQGDDSPDKKVLISAIMDGHCLATGIRIYTNDITFNYSDSYGHKVSISPSKSILAIECDLGLKQEFNPNKGKTNESRNIKNFNDFKKGLIE